MSFLQAIILGIVEGVTEFLPISSTAHLMFASEIMRIGQSDFVKSFEIIIQLGAIAAVVWMFGLKLVKNSWLWKKVLVAFIPTAVIGFLLYKIIKSYLIGNLVIACISLIIGGLALILIERIHSKRAHHVQDTSQDPGDGIESISNTQAFVIGLVQSLAVVPGISRSAATIVASMLFGKSRKAATEFSFFLAIPTVAAAAGYDVLKNFSIITSSSSNIAILAVGFVVSFIAAMFSIKLLLSYIQKHSFTSFGIYRIVIAVLFLVLFV